MPTWSFLTGMESCGGFVAEQVDQSRADDLRALLTSLAEGGQGRRRPITTWHLEVPTRDCARTRIDGNTARAGRRRDRLRRGTAGACTSKPRGSGFAVWRGARPRSRRASHRRRRWSRGTSSIRRRSIARSQASTWPTTSCTRWGHTATTVEKDRVAARNFGEAARRAGVRRIVYLGGLATGERGAQQASQEPDRDRRRR